MLIAGGGDDTWVLLRCRTEALVTNELLALGCRALALRIIKR